MHAKSLFFPFASLTQEISHEAVGDFSSRQKQNENL